MLGIIPINDSSLVSRNIGLISLTMDEIFIALFIRFTDNSVYSELLAGLGLHE